MRGVGVAELCRMADVAAAGYRQVPGVDLRDVKAAVVGDLLEVIYGWAQGERQPDNARGYLWTVAQAAAQLAAWRYSSPVTVTEHARRTRAPFQSVSEDLLCEWASQQPGPEAALAARQWRAAVAARVLELAAKDSAEDQAVVRRVLLEEAQAQEAADALSVPVARVWVVTQRMRRRILADARMRELHAELGAGDDHASD